MHSSSSSPLSQRDLAIVQTVARLHQVSANHLLRLYFFDLSPASRRFRAARTLARLARWGQLRRIDRPIGGSAGGSAGYIYTPPGSRARLPNPHTLDITETYVRLVERERVGEIELLAFDVEPWCHATVGHVQLKPDFFTRVRTDSGTYQFFGECDLGTEFKSQLSTKMARYSRAFERWEGPTFPLCLWTVPTPDRLRLVEGVIKRQTYPELHEVVLYEQAAERLSCG